MENGLSRKVFDTTTRRKEHLPPFVEATVDYTQISENTINVLEET